MTLAETLRESVQSASGSTAREAAANAGCESHGVSQKDNGSTAVIPAEAAAEVAMSGSSAPCFRQIRHHLHRAAHPARPCFPPPSPHRFPSPTPPPSPHRFPSPTPPPFPPPLLPSLPRFRFSQGSMFFDQFNVSSIAPLLPSFAKLFRLPETSSTLLLAGRSTSAILFALPACPLLSCVTTFCGLTVTLLLYAATLVLLAYPAGPLWLAGALMLQGICTQLVRAGALSFATHAHSPSALPSPSPSASASASACASPHASPTSAAASAQKLPQVLPGEDGALSPHPSDLVPALAAAPATAGEKPESVTSASSQQGKAGAATAAAAEAPKTAAAALGGRELLFGAVAMLFAWAAVGSVAGPVTMTFLFQFGSPSLPFLFSLGIDAALLFLLLFVLPCCCGGRRRNKVADVESVASAVAAAKAKDGSGKAYIEYNGTISGGSITEAPLADSLPTWQLQVSEQERPVVYRGAPIFAIPSRSSSLTRSTSARSSSRSAAADVPLSPMGSLERGHVEIGVLGQPSAVDPTKPKQHRPNQRLSALRLFATMLTDGTSATLLALTFLQTLSNGLLEVTVSFFLDNTCDHSPSEIGISMGINGASYALFSLLFGGYLIRKLGPPATITLGAATLAATLPLLVIPGVSCQLHVLYPLIALTGVAYSLVEFPSLPCIIQALDKRAAAGEGSSDVALAVGMFNLAYTAGYASGPLLSALLGVWLKAWQKMAVISGAFVLLLPFLCCMRR
ncbi:unnamed protein product [Closterium sp. NIES-65]|nr:unnamed protein product [Closterium sp. NIES-65]